MLNIFAGLRLITNSSFVGNISQMFMQSDWPTIGAVNLPSGGAAYPLSTPGVRFQVNPVKHVWLRVAMLNGDPAGPGLGDEQLRNRYGLNFRIKDPPFFIGEAEWQHNYGNGQPLKHGATIDASVTFTLLPPETRR